MGIITMAHSVLLLWVVICLAVYRLRYWILYLLPCTLNPRASTFISKVICTITNNQF